MTKALLQHKATSKGRLMPACPEGEIKQWGKGGCGFCALVSELKYTAFGL